MPTMEGRRLRPRWERRGCVTAGRRRGSQRTARPAGWRPRPADGVSNRVADEGLDDQAIGDGKQHRARDQEQAADRAENLAPSWPDRLSRGRLKAGLVNTEGIA